MIQKTLTRIFNNYIDPASGLVHHYYRSVHYDYFRKRNYYHRNSVFIENIYDKIATDVAMSKFKHVKITKVKELPDSMDFQEFSSLQNVLSLSPNYYETPIIFWTNVVKRMLKNRVAVVVPTYHRGEIESIHLAECISEIIKDKITLTVNDKEITVNTSSVWIFENPKTTLSLQLDEILRLIDSHLRSLSERITDNTALRGFLKLPTKTEDGILKKKAQDRVDNIMDVASKGHIGYLQSGEEFQELTRDYSTATNEELEFLKTQLYNTTGLNEDLFTCNYSETQYRAYFSSILKLYQRVIHEEINRKYFSKTARSQGHKLLMYYDMFDIASLKDLNEFAFKMKYSAIMNANEIREIFGYGGYIGGENYETNANAVNVTDDGGDI